MNRKTSPNKLKAALLNLELANIANKQKEYGIWKCLECGCEKKATVHQKRQKYCSYDCMSKAYKTRLQGSQNPNYSNAGYRTCKICNNKFKSYQKQRKYCSLKCRDIEFSTYPMRLKAKKDANHNEIVAILEAGGVVVKDMSTQGRGFPDILAWHLEAWYLIEIKNPKTEYGRKGLNKNQIDFLKDWKGGPVFVMRTNEEANNFVAGKLELLEIVGGKIEKRC
jgi:Holliday junction resolvase